jgi:periodic tryptophan protein 1
MITAATWAPRGFAAPFPQKYDFDEEEFERIASLAKLNLDDANDDLEEAKAKEEKGSSDAEDSKKETDGTKDEYARFSLILILSSANHVAVLRLTTT